MDLNSIFSSFQDVSETITALDVFVSLLLSFGLSFIIAWVYRATYKGTSYSQTYVHTLIIMSMIVTVIMLIIGSNIARAFSLVGALSIIRFRNAMKDTRDVGYIFFAMAIGMATGTGFYLLAAISTAVISFALWELTSLNLFAREIKEQILKIWVPEDMDYEAVFDDIFPRYLVQYRLLAVKTGKGEALTKLEYAIEFREQAGKKPFLDHLRRLTYNKPVSLITEHNRNEVW